MDQITTIGLDLAKSVFHVVGFTDRGNEKMKKALRRKQVLAFFARLPPCTIGMEACASSHYWARELMQLGHRVRLIPAQHVKAFLRGNKNDYNDARAIAEALGRPAMRFVKVKSIEEQDIQALHRLRQGAVAERTALCNRLRGLLAEYGLVVPRGVNVLRRRIPEWLEDAENGLSGFFRQLLNREYQRLRELDAHVDYYKQQLLAYSQQSEACQRLQTVPGFGPILASCFHGVVGDGSAYRRGRDVAASLGVVPKQYSTGGKQTLLGISKRGNKYLRALLIHGARSAMRAAANKEDRLSRWVNRVRAERGENKATVALANKMARIGWAILAHGTEYHPAQGA